MLPLGPYFPILDGMNLLILYHPKEIIQKRGFREEKNIGLQVQLKKMIMETTTQLTIAQSFNSSGRNKMVSRKTPAGENQGVVSTDVTFVSQSARAAAVKRGAGVMIGDYFVGVTTGSDHLFSHPIIVY